MTRRERIVRAARRARHGQLLRRGDVHEVITVNDDFTDHVTDVPHLARTRQPLLILTQESKRTDYRQRLDDDAWGVRQRMSDDATQGVAVVWNRQLARAIGSGMNRPRNLGAGWIPLAVPDRGDDMLVRGIVWQDLQLRDGGQRFRAASTHRPPARHRDHWAEFDDQLEAFLDASPIPVLVGSDNNQAGGPDIDPDYRWRGIGIDGFLGDIAVRSVYELAKRHSDHRAISGAAQFDDGRVAA
ncbi:hypothetical protein [Nocardioides sp. SYSU D00065]|uniref:hypothetical protein n=1 Tax=Nocardioides sp. SYSU D00065 TaxID=2817378 RepID=UPI001B32E762|nr:hypothetical protein [Nocardioides sp. SYSU D00065]